MRAWVTFVSGGDRGRVGELLDTDDEDVRVRLIGAGAEEIVIARRESVEPVDDPARPIRAWIERDHAELARTECLSFFVERGGLPADDLAAEWDAYLLHEARVHARIDARKVEALTVFDQELAALPAAELVAAMSADTSRWLPYFSRRGDDDHFDDTPEARLVTAIFDPSLLDRWDRPVERRDAAAKAAEARGLRRWRADLAREEGHAASRAAAAERVRRDRPVIERRFRDEWGVTLPGSIFTFWEFLLSLGPAERQAFTADLRLAAVGIMDFFDAPQWRPPEGDARMHWRYYWDPPEFLTFLNGSYPGEHYGLWFDDGRTCAGVLGHSPKDNSDFGLPDGVTPLQVVREEIELHALHDDGEEPDASRRVWLLRERLMEWETADWPEQGSAYILRPYPHRDGWYDTADAARISTLDGAGALVTGETVLPRGPQKASEDQALTRRIRAALDGDARALEARVAEARRRCAAGDPAEALALGRDLHFVSDGADRRRVADRERHAAELLALAYRALGRDNLAEIAEIDRREREIPWAGAYRD
jgi:hypothetical protein